MSRISSGATVRAAVFLLVAIACLSWQQAAFGATPAVAAGDQFTIALKTDGTIWAWGSNANGQLGDGSTASRATPAPVAGLVGVVAIAAGQAHALALRADGTVWAWGRNTQGQLGDGTTTDRSTPTQVVGLCKVTAIAAGGDHSLALCDDGTVMGWGSNDFGQIGDGTLANNVLPVRVNAPSGTTSIAAGRDVSFSILSDGTVWAWGRNNLGQLGDGTVTNRILPVRIDPYGIYGVANVIALASSGYTTYALRADGSVMVWGDDSSAQLGVRPAGGAGYSSTPLTLPGLTNIIKIAAGTSHAVAIQDDGTTWAWGGNSNGQAGTGVPGTPQWVYAPAQVTGAENAIDVAAGSGHTVVLASNHTMLAWGSNSDGQLGTGTLSGTASPVEVVGGRGAGIFNVASGPSPQAGWWWDPAQSGRGFTIEERANSIFFGAYLYGSGGRATWLVATGAVISSSVFQGDLLAFDDGQSLTGPYRSNASLPSPGRVTLQFIDASHGILTWPGGTIPIERFNIVPNGLNAPPATFQPETGWWWNASEPGRGFFLEIQKGTLFMAGYMYDSAGNAVWYVSNNVMTNPRLYQGTWVQYGNGQTLTGGYVEPVLVNANVGAVTLQFSDTANALLTLPDGSQLALSRFRF